MAAQPPTGEENQKTGREAARRAKEWLENTTRVWMCWANPDNARKLQYQWPSGGTWFSYDLGGVLRGDPFSGDHFLAEVKSADHDEGNQPTEYISFLAKCYVAFSSDPHHCDHFLWMSWCPFRGPAYGNGHRKWAWLTTGEAVAHAVAEHRDKVFKAGLTKDDAAELIDSDTCEAVASRLWLIVLSEKQEQLVITEEHRKKIYGEWGAVGA